MASGLKRYQQTGHLHFVTFSCYRRQAYLETPVTRDLFRDALERTQPHYYDFNVFTEHKRMEKLEYMHWNPVRRGLVSTPEDWQWSS